MFEIFVSRVLQIRNDGLQRTVAMSASFRVRFHVVCVKKDSVSNQVGNLGAAVHTYAPTPAARDQ